MIIVIIISALNVGARTYQGLDPYRHVLSYLDVGITVIFAIEIVIRLIAAKARDNFSKIRGIFLTRLS